MVNPIRSTRSKRPTRRQRRGSTTTRRSRRRLALETLEPRIVLSGYTDAATAVIDSYDVEEVSALATDAVFGLISVDGDLDSDASTALLAEGEGDDDHPWQNASLPADVNADTSVTPLDALVLINRLNAEGSGSLPVPPSSTSEPPPYLDVNGDDALSPLDVLLVINYINSADSVSDTTYISLQGGSISVEGSGAEAEGGVVTVTSAGTYSISGTLDDGQVIVDTDDEEDVTLILNGVDITCSNNAPIYVANAEDTVIALANGTQNYVTDGESYENGGSDEPDAAIFSKDDLDITGYGSLTVYANFNDGIVSKDDLDILGGNITVTAVNHGIRGKDSVEIVDGTITVSAGGDGVQSNNDEDSTKGYVMITGGTLDITAAKDGIQAETTLAITGGDISVSAGGGSNSGSDDAGKGLKAAVDITIEAGTVDTVSIDVDSADDAIHCDGTVTISGGNITLATADDAVRSESTVAITGGDISIATCYEGIDAAAITINNATIDLVSSDDGISAVSADGTSSTVSISGGTLAITAGADGIAAESQVLISGGTITVSSGGGSTMSVGSTESAKGIRSDANITIEGGTVNVDSADDALHANDSLTITGGSINLAAYDDAIHADSAITIDGGDIDITKCYEGIESAEITINDGEIHLVSSDDGFNVSDGSSSGTGGPWGGGGVIDGSLNINGGYTVLNTEGDGLDSNGDVEVTGGTIIVHGPTGNNNGALDSNGTFLMSGGFLIAVGSSRMAESPDESSTQAVLVGSYGAVQAAGTMLHVETEDGEEILTFVPAKTYQSFVICSPQLEAGATYVVFSGGSSTGTVTDGLYTGGTYTPGTELGTLTI